MKKKVFIPLLMLLLTFFYCKKNNKLLNNPKNINISQMDNFKDNNEFNQYEIMNKQNPNPFKPNATDPGTLAPCQPPTSNCTILPEIEIPVPGNYTLFRQFQIFDSIILQNDKDLIKEFLKNNEPIKIFLNGYHPSFFAQLKSGQYYILKEFERNIERNNHHFLIKKYLIGKNLPITFENKECAIQIEFKY